MPSSGRRLARNPGGRRRLQKLAALAAAARDSATQQCCPGRCIRSGRGDSRHGSRDAGLGRCPFPPGSPRLRTRSPDRRQPPGEDERGGKESAGRCARPGGRCRAGPLRGPGREGIGANRSRKRSAGDCPACKRSSPRRPGPGRKRIHTRTPSTDRSLRRLERDLQESADACQKDPEACARALRQAGESLGSEMSGARSSSERNQLARTLEQELARQGAGRSGQGGEQVSARSGERSATGAPALGRGWFRTRHAVRKPVKELESASVRLRGRRGQERGRGFSRGAGTGTGTGTGGDRTEEGRVFGQGEKREVRVQSGSGPSRAEIIEAGARGGFAEPGYQTGIPGIRGRGGGVARCDRGAGRTSGTRAALFRPHPSLATMELPRSHAISGARTEPGTHLQ